MNMNFNFFTWVREGVKQAVLLGVADAVEELGAPEDNEEISQRLQTAAVRANQAIEGEAKTAAVGAAAPKRKRLGRRLSDMDAATEAGN